MTKSKREYGFSLIELLIVVVIVGIIAAVAIPSFQKGIWAAENGRAFSTLRTMSSTQIAFYSQNSRFGTLPELNSIMNNALGFTTGNRIVRGSYVFEMSPVSPTPAELKDQYVITARRTATGDIVYKYELNQSGEIIQLLP